MYVAHGLDSRAHGLCFGLRHRRADPQTVPHTLRAKIELLDDWLPARERQGVKLAQLAEGRKRLVAGPLGGDMGEECPALMGGGRRRSGRRRLNGQCSRGGGRSGTRLLTRDDEPGLADLRIVQNSATAPPWLQFVHGFFGRQKIWPPQQLTSVYFGRPWYLQEFSHDPGVRSNCYAALLLRGLLQPPDRRPQVLHFAFKHPSLFHARWLEYGLVRIQGGSAVLHHINGYTDQLDLAAPDAPVAVESWFGPGPALFRVASLHPFTLRMAEGEPGIEKVLRFPG